MVVMTLAHYGPKCGATTLLGAVDIFWGHEAGDCGTLWGTTRKDDVISVYQLPPPFKPQKSMTLNEKQNAQNHVRRRKTNSNPDLNI